MDYRRMLFVTFGFIFLFRCETSRREYRYVNIDMTWSDAQRYCRDKHADLATFDSMDDILRLTRPSMVSPYAWIGLWDDPQAWRDTMGSEVNSWKWSATEAPSSTGYSNWGLMQPDYKTLRDPMACVSINIEGKWSDLNCSLSMEFICYDDSTPPGQKNYTLVTMGSSWDEARSYCRAHHKDLAMVENAQEQSRLLSVIATDSEVDQMWIGLYRQPWTWSNRSSVPFKNWLAGQPDGLPDEPQDANCGLEDEGHSWYDAPCDEKLPFLCYDDVHHVRRITLRLQSKADLSDPAINQQILQQINKVLPSEFKVKWIKEPKKEEPGEEPNAGDLHCNL